MSACPSRDILRFCRNPKIYSKPCPHPKFAVHFDSTVMRFNNCFCKRQPQADSLRVFGKPASVKPLKDMMQILRMDSASIVCHDDLHHRSQCPPFDPNHIPCFRMVEGIFHNIVNGFRKPFPVTLEGNIV